MQKVEVPVVDFNECNATYSQAEVVVYESAFCAADNNSLKPKDACLGDSGGPLIHGQGREPKVLG